MVSFSKWLKLHEDGTNELEYDSKEQGLGELEPVVDTKPRSKMSLKTSKIFGKQKEEEAKDVASHREKRN